MIHRYIPKAKRKARSRRMLAAKEEKRLARGIDADTARWRALHPVPVAERTVQKTYNAKPLPGRVFTKRSRSEKRIVTGWHSGRVYWRRFPDGQREHVATAEEWKKWAETAWV